MIVQSFWSKPFLKDSNHPNARFKGGWLNEKYYYYSIALSCLKFKEFYNEVELFTDSNGIKILKDTLNISYTKYHNTLDSLNHLDENLWALPKLHTYSIQEKPFLHADTDVFIWEKFNPKIVDSPIFCQNIEDNYPIYNQTLDEILRILDWIPTEIINGIYKHRKVLAFNAGVIGGTNLDFYKNLHSKALKMISKNQHLFEKIDVGMLNMIYEQLLGYAIADKKDIQINPLFDNIDSNFTELTNIHLASFHSKYVHAIGYAKKSLYACEQIEALLMYEFPEEYDKIKFNGEKNSLWISNHEISKKRKEFLFANYNFSRTNSLDIIYDVKFQLNSSSKIIENNDTTILYYVSPQSLQKEQLNLEDWDSILLYFQEPISINQLSLELLEDNDISTKYTEDTLKQKLLSFVFDKCLLHEILIPDFISK